MIMYKVVLLIVLNGISFGISRSAAQVFQLNYKYSTPGVVVNHAGQATNDVYDQLNAQLAANSAAQLAEYGRQVVRFDRKLSISQSVVAKMRIAYSKATKYRQAQDLYLRSLENYKKLQPLSERGVEYSRQQRNMDDLQRQQEVLISKALDDYHKAETLVELGENKAKIIDEEAKNLLAEKCLSPPEKMQLKELTDTIKFLKNQIQKLKTNVDPLKKLQRDLDIKQAFQTAAQALVTMSKVVLKAVSLMNPSKGATQVIGLTQSMVEKYIEENIENGKSPEVAISQALRKGYEKYERDELSKVSSPIKKLSRIPLLAEDLAKEIQQWDKIAKSQQSVMNRIDDVLRFTDDGIKRNQQIIDRSTANSKAIIDKAITRYLNKSLSGKKVMP